MISICKRILATTLVKKVTLRSMNPIISSLLTHTEGKFAIILVTANYSIKIFNSLERGLYEDV